MQSQAVILWVLRSVGTTAQSKNCWAWITSNPIVHFSHSHLVRYVKLSYVLGQEAS